MANLSCQDQQNTLTVLTENKHIDYAREWVGTPFHLQGNVKGVGVDCCNVVFGSLMRAGLINHIEILPYMINEVTRPGELMQGILLNNVVDGLKIIQVDDIKAGDLLVFKLGGLLRHISIASSQDVHIHTCEERGVIEGMIEPAYLKRIAVIYRFING